VSKIMGWEIMWNNDVKEIASQIIDALDDIEIVRENEDLIRELTEEIVEQMEETFEGEDYEPLDVDEIVECIFWLGGQ